MSLKTHKNIEKNMEIQKILKRLSQLEALNETLSQQLTVEISQRQNLEKLSFSTNENFSTQLNILQKTFDDFEDTLNKTQYEENIITKPGSNDRVEFAVKMPGKEDSVFLPIDSKFPVENYSRLIAAYDEGSKADIATYQKALANDVKEQAKKFINLDF